MQTTYNDIRKAVIRSQHCQRNWNLDKQIPEEDIDLLIHAVTKCPSKQNMSFYKVHFITDRNVIETIHENTDGFTINYVTGASKTNSQTLANLLLVFEATNPLDTAEVRNEETYNAAQGKLTDKDLENLNKDTNVAVGIAAGYANLTASMLGLSTGCCSCFNPEPIKELIGANNKLMLLMGIGYKDETRHRREHHSESDFTFPTKKKQEIEINRI